MSRTPGADLELWFRVQAFFHREARLLDDRQFEDWVDLFSDDLRYWMPLVSNRTGRDVGKELSQYGEVAHFDEDKTSLSNRVKRLGTGMAWAETPASRTRHMVGNVEVMDRADDGTLTVRSNFMLYRSHLEYDFELFSGVRHDALRPHQDAWLICQRSITLDQAVVTQKNLGIFF
jgi:3-phenylpropionate/cinnamic acid dioxygenase small subunit